MFAQESVMGIQKEREAFQKFCEENFDFERHEQTYFDEQTQCYENDIGEDTESINMAWSAWQAAKAQSVPDVQQALNDRLLVRSIKEQVESHIAEISVNDLFDKGWFAAMKCIQSNIDMLEAREQTHD
ncbi:MAG: hypothetical protein JNL15_14035 [Acinetobacter johnsonii]|nr:hypothetical protein [Acinetobacter johnsonii]